MENAAAQILENEKRSKTPEKITMESMPS